MSGMGSDTGETPDAPTGCTRHVAMPRLPLPATPLVGRDRAVREVLALLSDPDARLVTLTGPGGIGKTRLALAVAMKSPQQAAFVPLATITDPDLIATAALQALGIGSSASGRDGEALRDELRERQLLLVLDNLEHLLAGTPLISDLLGACPGLSILATSRIRLGLSGEHVVPVEPLDAPDPGHLPSLPEVAAASGVRLFVERARAIQHGFALTERNAAAIVTICQRLDGLPLAIELAAARTRVLPPDVLAERLERRLEVLTDGRRDMPERHQTMRATISWSYELLPPAEQRLFRRLAVFDGGAALDAVAAIATAPAGDAPAGPDDTDAVDLLSTLVDHNLVVRSEVVAGSGETRVGMVGVIREFARELLSASGEEAAMRDAHAAIFLALATEGETHLVREVDPEWLDRLELDHPNFRRALAWTLREDAGPAAATIGAQIAGALWLFWYYHSHLAEGRAWLERALAVSGEIPVPARARVLLGLGMLLHFLGQPGLARGLLLEGLARLRELGDLSGAAYALTGLGNIAEDIGEYDYATQAFTQAGALFARLDDRVNVAVTRYHLGVIAVGQGNLPVATQRLEEALSLSRGQSDPWSTAAALSYLGLVRVAASDLHGAADALAEALALYRQLGTTERIVEVLRRVGVLASTRGDAAAARRLFAAADAHGARIGMIQALPERTKYERALAEAERRMPAARRVQEAASGAALSLDEAIAEAERQIEAREIAPRGTPSPRAGPTTLSPREVEVLRLMAEGRSNHEIAVALRITTRTVSQHVAAILGKLGASNRTAAATIALRRGLV